ncbi:MAG: gas vesicle protein [Solirubrobacterales bacterium]|nr:gas vesicle protein [Solirubrobacterales bacterium]
MARSPRSGPRMSQVSLIDLLDRLLQGGIVIQGDIILSAADIDLVGGDLRLIVAAVDKFTGV